MSTHRYQCVVCERDTYCTRDTHSLSAGANGCYTTGIRIDFCSVACFLVLRERLNFARDHAEEWAPGLFSGVPTSPRSEKDISGFAVVREFEGDDDDKVIAYIEPADGGDPWDPTLILRARWLRASEALKLARWILQHVPPDEEGDDSPNI